MSLRRGADRYGNLDRNQRRILDISDRLKPVLSRKIYELPQWQQSLISFDITNVVKNNYKRTCFCCSRRKSKDSVKD